MWRPHLPLLLRALRKLLPRSFRSRYGRDLDNALIDQIRTARSKGELGVGLWARVAVDLILTVVVQWWGVAARTGSVLAPGVRARSLLRQPSFTLVAVGIVALGLSAAMVVAAFGRGLLWAPLPYEDGERIAIVFNNGQTARPTFSTRWPVSGVQYDLFSQAAGAPSTWIGTRTDAPYRSEVGVEQVSVSEVSPDFFEFLGISAGQGRLFTEGDQESGVVLSDAAWRRRFGGEVSAVGSEVELDGRRRVVVGVLPSHFRWVLADAGRTPDFWIPESSGSFYDRWLLVRLGAGYDLERARAEFGPIAFDHFTNPGYKERFTPDDAATADLLRDHALKVAAEGVPMAVGAVALLVMLSTLSVALLILGRTGARGPELAVHRALGGSRGTIVGMILLDCALVVGAGSVLGAAIAPAGIGLSRAMLPSTLPRVDAIGIDAVTLLAYGLVTLAVWVLSAVPPAWFAARLEGWRASDRSDGGGVRGRRIRHAIIALQSAAAVTLLVATTLMLRSWHAMETEDLGFHASGVLAARMELPLEAWHRMLAGPDQAEAEGRALLRASGTLFDDLARLRSEIEAFPGVRAVSLARYTPLSGTYGGWSPVTLEGWEDRSWEERPDGTAANWVDRRYFEVLGIAPLQGRLFTEADLAPDAAPVAVVSDLFAETFWPGEDPLGKRFYEFGAYPQPDGSYQGRRLTEVVGVVPTQREVEVRDANATAFLPHRPLLAHTTRPPRELTILVKTDVPPRELAVAVRRAAAGVFLTQPLLDVGPLPEVVSGWVDENAFLGMFLTGIGLFAFALALAGIAGVVGFHVSGRAREVGIRIALGARPRQVQSLFIRDVAMTLGLGVVAGVLGAVVASRVLSNWLYGLESLDPATYVAVAVGFALAAGVAATTTVAQALRRSPRDAIRST